MTLKSTPEARKNGMHFTGMHFSLPDAQGIPDAEHIRMCVRPNLQSANIPDRIVAVFSTSVATGIKGLVHRNVPLLKEF